MSEQNKISFRDRFEAFKEEWIEFIKKELTNNIEPWFYVWLAWVQPTQILLIRCVSWQISILEELLQMKRLRV